MKKIVSILSAMLIMASALTLTMTTTSCGDSSTIEFKAAIALANMRCPIDLGDGYVITKIYTKGNNLIYNCECPTDLVESINDPYGYEVAHDELLYFVMNDRDTREFVELCVETKHNIVYRYVDNYGNSANVVLKYHELE
jgi:hypothetical protein